MTAHHKLTVNLPIFALISLGFAQNVHQISTTTSAFNNSKLNYIFLVFDRIHEPTKLKQHVLVLWII